MTLPAGLFAGTAQRVRKALQSGTELGKIQQQALENPLDFAAPMGTTGAVRQMLTSGVAAKLLPASTRRGIEAWHGTPHEFDRFDISKIGTGEGGAAYGQGLYFGGARPVGEKYRQNLTKTHIQRAAQDSYDQYDDPSDAFEALMAHPSMTPKYREFLTSLRDRDDLLGFSYPHQAVNNFDHPNFAEDMSAETRALREKLGSLFRTRIDADPAELLDWDAPVHAQAEAVRRAADAAKSGEQVTGGQLYRDLAARAGKGGASATLRDQGVPGLQYFDRQSRGAKEGTRNYVLFDDQRVKILERLAAMGLSGEGLRQMVARAKGKSQHAPQSQQSQQQPRTPGGW